MVRVAAPAGTPADFVLRLNAAANQALQDARIRERLTTDGQFAGGTPDDFADFLKRSDEQWRPILQRLDVPR